MARPLKKAGLDSINVSINSLNRESYEEITGKDFLPNVIEGLKSAIDEKIEVKVNTIFTKYVLDELDEFIDFSKRLKIPVKFFELIDPDGLYKG